MEQINEIIPELTPQRIVGRVDERVAAVVPGGTLLRPGAVSGPGLAPGGTPEDRAARILDGGVASGTSRGWTPEVVQGGGNKVPTPDEAHAAYIEAIQPAQRRFMEATDKAETTRDAGGGKTYEQMMDEANDVYRRETAEAAEAYERALEERPRPTDVGLSSGVDVKGAASFKAGQAYLDFFETGDLETLLHEPAHVLRSMLPAGKPPRIGGAVLGVTG